jgi:hypothetical protein
VPDQNCSGAGKVQLGLLGNEANEAIILNGFNKIIYSNCGVEGREQMTKF